MHHYQPSVRPLLHSAVLLDDIIGSKYHCGKDVGNEDAVPSFEVFDDDLARLEDEVVLQLPDRPPAADHEAVDDEVAKDGVQYNVPWGSGYGFTEVTVWGEDISDAVFDDNNGGPSCTLKCIHGKKRD